MFLGVICDLQRLPNLSRLTVFMMLRLPRQLQIHKHRKPYVKVRPVSESAVISFSHMSNLHLIATLGNRANTVTNIVFFLCIDSAEVLPLN